MIESGEKTIELRLYDEKRRAVKKGDEIVFTNLFNGKKLRTRVKETYIFNNFDELYKYLPLDKCGYKHNETALPEDMEAYYSKERQKMYGAVGIEIELM